MATSAIYPFGRSGQEEVRATDLNSHEHARKFWPLFADALDPNNVRKRHLVVWVRPHQRAGRRVAAHFRALREASFKELVELFEREETQRQRESAESPEHRRAKELVAAALERRRASGLGLEWHYRDPKVSDYPFSGNLLHGASRVVCEYSVKTAFDRTYRLDVAVLADPIAKNEQVVGGVEIEWKHPFDGRKAMIARSQGFVLISLDIRDMALDELTPEWADRALTLTTRQDPDGRRPSFVYLHDLLYPLYQRLPAEETLSQTTQQLIVFAPSAELDAFRQAVLMLSDSLGLKKHGFVGHIQNAKSPQARVVVDNHGAIVGEGWKRVNADACLLLTLPRISVTDAPRARLYLCAAMLLLTRYHALVGYKYEPGLLPDDSPESDIWVLAESRHRSPPRSARRLLPKRLAIPKDWWLDLTERGLE